MTKKTKILMGIIAGLLVLASAAGGLYWGLSTESIFGKEGNLADVEWYDEEAEEFTITTKEELYDLITLSRFYSFEEQTVKLGADIVVNEGNASDWAKKAPENKWFPIENFAGTFDGQGHTISGLYGKGIDSNMGLFANTKPKAVIQDFKLLNSYFVASGANVGAISANGSGTYKNIYTDAIISNDSKDGTGGFIGKVDAAGASAVVGFFTTFENCWFDGEINMTKRDGVTVGGFVGIFTSGTLEIRHSKSSGVINVPSIGRSPQTGGFVGDTKVELGNLIINLEGLVSDTKINTNEGVNYAASYIGHVRAKCKLDIKNCYVTYECFEGNAIGTDNNDHTGEVLQMNAATLTGMGGYKWTALDFNQYWSVVEDDIPTLKCFAKEHLSVEGVKKAYNIDWYSEYKKEMVLQTPEEFMGFCLLPYMEGVTYKGQIVKLGCDVVINEGNAKEWGEKAPDFRLKPVGVYKIPFQGIFDGQGHSISGIYARGTNYVGLFGYAEQESEIKNVKILNSYFQGSTAVGSLVGRTKGSIDTVYSNATVVSTGNCVGGIVGQSLEQKKPPIKQTINNCWFDGTIDMLGSGFSFAGGILGDNRNNVVTITNCLFTGTITSQANTYNVFIGGICGVAKNAEAATIIKGCLSTGKMEAPMSEKKSGVASLLGYAYNKQSKIVDSYAITECWEGATSYLGNSASKAGQWPKARLTGVGGYQWTTLDFEHYWTVVSGGTPILQSFATKKQSVAGVERYLDNGWYDETKNEFVLDSRADLIYFNIVAGSETFAEKTVKLGADIVLNSGDAKAWGESAPEIVWTPIGTGSYPFAGTFDGQGHSISGLYVKREASYAGMFAVTGEDSMIKNMKLQNSYIEGTDLVGSIVGRLRGDLDTIYSDAYIVASGPCNGGIAGQTLTTGKTQLEIKINNCWYDGEMQLNHNKWLYSGGILGDNRNNLVTITNCLYTGLINTVSDAYNVYLGGINGSTGIINSVKFEQAKTTISGCLSTGDFKTKSKNNGRVGAIVGETVNANSTVTDCYVTEEGWQYGVAYIGGKLSNELMLPEAVISGNAGYQFTTLDFEKYWTVVPDSTPILKSFATSPVNPEGKRLVDYSWYKKNESVYVLDSKEDLLAFDLLCQVNRMTGKTVKLGANIELNDGDSSTWRTNAPAISWLPIGESYVPFEGTFDGQGYEISGMYMKQDGAMVGMFGVLGEGAVVRNFKLLNSYVEGAEIVASIVARARGSVDTVYSDATVVATTGVSNGGIVGQTIITSGTKQIPITIDNCWYAGNMFVETDSWAHSAGILGDNRNNVVTITNCLFTGSITTNSESYNVYLGGINGTTGMIKSARFENAKTMIDSCLSTGKLKTSSAANTSVGAILGNSAKDTVTVTNSYGSKAGWKYATIFANDGTTGSMIGMWDADKFAGFNGYAWTNLDFTSYWAVVENGAPILKSFAKEVPEIGDRVRYVTWYNGADTVFKLDTKEDLIGLSELAKVDDFSGKQLLLEADVALNEGEATKWATEPAQMKWQPIGSNDKPFAGTFNGQMHTISGLYTKGTEYVGLFGVTAPGSLIQNLKLTNSYVEADYILGSVVGRTNGTIHTVYSDAILRCSTMQKAGGIAGQIGDAGIKVENCWFDGTIYADKAAGDFRIGGIVGENEDNKTAQIKGCLFSGSIEAKKAPATAIDMRIGGIIGFDNYATTVIDNCVSVGSITTTATATPSYIGSIMGRASDKTFPKPTNTYGATECWPEGTAYWGYNNLIKDGQMPKASMLGGSGYVYGTMNLSPDYWVYVSGKTPELKSFAKGKVLTLTEQDKPDTAWYTSTASGKKYTITTASQFLGFGLLSQTNTFVGQTIELSSALKDGLDLHYTSMTPIGTSAKPFAGTFNGNGKTIKGLNISVNEGCVGMFRYTAVGSVIRNFRLIDSRIQGTEIVGGIVGRAKGNVDTIYCEAEIIATTGACNGGIIGQTWTSPVDVENCWYAGTLYVNGNVKCYSGGILGDNRATTVSISNCLYSGNIITASSQSDVYLGGINGVTGVVGSNASAVTTITGCLSRGGFKTKSSNNNFVAGILGKALNNNTTVTNCFSQKESWKWAFAFIGNSHIADGLLQQSEMVSDKLKSKLDNDYWVFIENRLPQLKDFRDDEN